MNIRLTGQSQLIVYSVILPVYNERENLQPLIQGIIRILSETGKSYEVVCVDDHSSDGSLECMCTISNRHPNVRVLKHIRNYGQSAALASGIACASGEIIVTLDSDQQNNPRDIPVLLAALTDDVDAVCGVRVNRQENYIRKVSSRVANAFRNWITGDTIRDSGCNFRVMRKTALAELPVFNGMHRFLPTLLRYQGFHVVEIPISHQPRTWGTSKYGIHNRLWRGVADCMAMRWWKKRMLPTRRLKRE